MNLKADFIKYCVNKKLQINTSQVNVINLLSKFYKYNQFSVFDLFKIFQKKNKKKAFYLNGDVGVGKTMILDFFYNSIKVSKQRFHFNEFMISFHDFRHANEKKGKNNSIDMFVNELMKKSKLIYFDEFQVTNIVDAMILGKLFEVIFNEDIKIIVTSNTKIKDLYKDGLQRDQFLPFISIIKNYSIEHELTIDEDYRKKGITKLERFFYPINEKTNFKINQLFRELTKGKKPSKEIILIKSREFTITDFFEGVAKFKFNDLCDRNLGGEDYIKIASKCDFILIEDVPRFNNENANKQQRFITLIDILYDKKIFLIISSNVQLNELGSSQKLIMPFKRTVSRIYELTSPNINAIYKH
jgi:cell division protein ZapE|tara:strand:+ start:282 stop:1352 length:1071 start_codon:yes stop_codon:yes gene_type:complete